MYLLSPVNSLESAKLQIANGCDEIYLGIDSDTTKRIALSGRARFTYDDKRIQVKISEYEKIVSLARANHISVQFAANLQFIPVELHTSFINYVHEAYEIGFNSIIIGDIGAYFLLRKHFPDIEAIASSYFNVTNIEAVRFFSNIGFSRVILTEHLSINEIGSICGNAGDTEIEVFAGYGCSNYNALCYFAHNAGEHIKIGPTCWKEFLRNDGNTDLYFGTSTDCSLCMARVLSEIGVHSLKIVGREMDSHRIAEITKMYSQIINKDNTEVSVDKIIDSEWKENFCKNKSCKYVNFAENKGEPNAL
jgi:putative protease